MFSHNNWDTLLTGMKAGSTINTLAIEYGQHGMKIRMKLRTGSLRPEKACSVFCAMSRVPCCDNIVMSSFVQCVMIQWPEPGPFA
jgi:hypothetical protein